MLEMNRFGEEESRFECMESEWSRAQVGVQAGASERRQG